MSNNDDYMDPILERKEAEAENREQRRHDHSGSAKEQSIEEQEKAQLYGPFKAQYITWFVIVLVVAFAALIIGAYVWPR